MEVLSRSCRIPQEWPKGHSWRYQLDLAKRGLPGAGKLLKVPIATDK